MSALDIIIIPIALFVFILAALVGYLVLSNLTGSALGTFIMYDSNGQPTSNNLVTDGLSLFSMFDQLGVLIVFGMSFAAFIAGFLVRSHPALFIVMVFVMIPAIVISVAFANAFETLIGSASFLPIAGAFPFATLLFSGMPMIAALLGLVLGVITYGKDSQGLVSA